MAAGIVGAGALAQLPEYSQQYEQRLAGAVDELAVVVADFDRTAEAAGLSRDEALEELAGTEFLDGRNADMTRTVRRFERLSRQLDRLRRAGPLGRAALVPLHLDSDVGRRALGEFEPGIPTTSAGLGFALAGFCLGYIGWAGGATAMRRAGARRRRAEPEEK
ncbi:MAG: DUF2937 family protein [Pseudomonadota bacterium]